MTGDFWEDSEIRAKLSFLREDAAQALDEYLGTAPASHTAAIHFITAQAKYTMACVEAQQKSILDYVELPVF